MLRGDVEEAPEVALETVGARVFRGAKRRLGLTGASAVVLAVFVAFMVAGSGRAAEHAAPAKEGAAANEKSDPAGVGGKADDAAKKMDGDKADAAKTPRAEEASGGPRRTKSKRKRDAGDESELPPGQGPPPPSPLTMTDLRQEVNRDRPAGGDFEAPPRVKLEQLLAEVTKARQSLHDDTQKLEALAGADLSRGADASSGEAPPAVAPPGAPGQPPQKNPLDVLGKALRGIKPEQAAPIVSRLDKGLAATVLLRMPPADAGKIMGALKPEIAAELATEIALRAPPSKPGAKR